MIKRCSTCINICDYHKQQDCAKNNFLGWMPVIANIDNVNHPSHYTGAIETIDYMQDKLSKDAFEGYCAGNVIKYISRYKKKNGLEDLKKCQWYLSKLIETLEEVKK